MKIRALNDFFFSLFLIATIIDINIFVHNLNVWYHNLTLETNKHQHGITKI